MDYEKKGKCSITAVKPYYFIYMNNYGSYMRLAENFRKLENIMEESRIKVSGLPQAFFLDDPSVTDEKFCRSEIGYIIGKKVSPVPAQAAIKQMPEVICAECVYRGDISKINGIYSKLRSDIASDGYDVCGYPWEVFFKHPAKAEADRQCDLKIYMPVCKRCKSEFNVQEKDNAAGH
jgi:effector-binding domain-containing protein